MPIVDVSVCFCVLAGLLSYFKMPIIDVSVCLYVLAGLSSYLFLRHILQETLGRRLKRLPPGPLGLPILGSLLQMGANPHNSLQRLSDKYGDLMSLRLGDKYHIIVSSPAMAKEIYKTHDKAFAGRELIEAFKLFGEDEKCFAFAQPGPYWRMLKKVSTSELFTPKKLHSLQHLRRAEVAQTIRAIYLKTVQGDSNCLEVRDIAARSSISLLGKIIFSRHMVEVENPLFHEFKDAVWRWVEATGTANVSDYMPWLAWLDPQHVVRNGAHHKKRVYAIFDKFIEKRLAERQTGIAAKDSDKDFLDILLDINSPDLAVSNIKVFLADLFGAGSGTTMITMEWAIAELIKNPSIMQKAQSEIDEVVGRERLVTESDTEHLPYLQAVVKETLRLHPATPLLVPHKAQETVEIAGYKIPKGTIIIINFWAIGKDPRVWEKPSEFMPERFLEKKLDFKGQDFELIPFGAGRRMCVGLPLASIVIPSLLGALIQGFSWSPPAGVSYKDVNMDEKFGVAMQMAHPLVARAVPRLPHQLYQAK